MFRDHRLLGCHCIGIVATIFGNVTCTLPRRPWQLPRFVQTLQGVQRAARATWSDCILLRKVQWQLYQERCQSSYMVENQAWSIPPSFAKNPEFCCLHHRTRASVEHFAPILLRDYCFCNSPSQLVLVLSGYIVNMRTPWHSLTQCLCWHMSGLLSDYDPLTTFLPWLRVNFIGT